MSARSRRGQRSGGSTGIVTQLLAAFLGRDSEIEQNPEFGKAPGDVSIGKGYDPEAISKVKYLDKGGGPLGTKFGKVAEYERLTGIDAAETKLGSDKALLQFTSDLQEQIRKAQANETGLLTASANQLMVQGQAPKTADQLSPILGSYSGTQDYNQGSLSNEYYGQALQKIPGLAQGRQQTSESLYASDKANLSREELGQNRGNALATSRNLSQGALLDSQRGLNPAVQQAKDKEAEYSILNKLNITARPGDFTVLGDGGILQGGGEIKEKVPIMFTGPDGKQYPTGQFEERARTTPGSITRIPKQKVDAILGLGGNPYTQSPEGATPLAPSGLLSDPSAAFKVPEAVTSPQQPIGQGTLLKPRSRGTGREDLENLLRLFGITLPK
jgi:hypothetical protein